MAITLTVPFAKLPSVFRKYGRNVREGVSPGLTRLAKQAGIIVTNSTRNAPPASANGSIGAVNYGKFLSKWRSTKATLNGNQGVLVSNASGIKGATIEWGGKWPNRPPPVSAIARWAQKKLSLPYSEAKKAAWPIARAIKRRGLRPRLVLTGPDTQSSFRLSMQNIFSDVVSKAAHKMGAP